MYKAFISYSHSDEDFARWLHRKLESYSLPKALAVNYPTPKPIRPVFRDQEELATSADLSASIRMALEQSENLILICSPAAAASRWVNEEVRYFQELGRGHRIFCVLHSGAVPAVLPAALAANEPLAADFRKDQVGTHGQRDGVLRLVAGMLDLGLDDLRRRQAQARQRRLALAVAGAAAITVTTSALAVLAYFGQQRAQQQAQVAQEVSDFLTGLFEISDPGIAQGRTITLREMLDRGAGQVADKFNTEPLVGAQLAVTMGRVYGNLGEAGRSTELYQQALQVYEQRLGEDHSSYASVLRALAEQRFAQGALMEAEQLLRQALAIHKSANGPGSIEVAADQTVLATTLFQSGADHNEVERLYREALAVREALLGPAHADTAQSNIHLGWYYMSRYQPETAEPYLRSALAARRATLGERHFLTSDAMEKLGRVYEDTGRAEEARTLYQQALAIKQSVLEPPHPQLVESFINLASAELALGNAQRAIDLAAQGVSMGEARLGPLHSDLARGLNIQEMAHQQLGEYEQALPIAQRVLEIYEASFDPQHELIGQALNNVGSLLGEQLGRPEAAEAPLRRAVAVLGAAQAATEWQAIAHWSLANSLRAQGKFEDAMAAYQQAMQLLDYGKAINVPGFPAYADLQADYQRAQQGLAPE